MTGEDRSRHPDAERLAQYADGTLTPNDRATVEGHLARCADCRSVAVRTMVFTRSRSTTAAVSSDRRPRPFRLPGWARLAVVGLGTAALIAIGIRVIRTDRFGDGLRANHPEQELVAALADEPTRPVQGRLTGAFKYAPPASPTRGAGDREASLRVRLAAAQVELKSAGATDARTLEALGLASLAVGDVRGAIQRLDRAAETGPVTVALQANAAAAYLERGRRDRSAEDLRHAVALADAAIHLGASREARFNKALALEALGQRDAANAAWRAYLQEETDPAWSTEARTHLRASP